MEKNKFLAGALVGIGILLILIIVLSGATMRNLGTTMVVDQLEGVTIDNFTVTAADEELDEPYVLGTKLVAQWSVQDTTKKVSRVFLSQKEKKEWNVVKNFGKSSDLLEMSYDGIKAYNSSDNKNAFQIQVCRGNKCIAKEVIVDVVAKKNVGRPVINSFKVTGPNGAETAMPGETLYFSWDATSPDPDNSTAKINNIDVGMQQNDADKDGTFDAWDMSVTNGTYNRENGKLVTAVVNDEGVNVFILSVCEALSKKCDTAKATIKVKKSKESEDLGALTIDKFGATLVAPSKGKQGSVNFAWMVSPENKFRYVEVYWVKEKKEIEVAIPAQYNSEKDSLTDKYDSNVAAADLGEKLAPGASASYKLKAYDMDGKVIESSVVTVNNPLDTNPVLD